MNSTASHLETICRSVNRERLLDTARQLVAIPSKTGHAGDVSNHLDQLLRRDGFRIQREAGGHSDAPAVLARCESGSAGKCLQFNGHLDVVHLPYVPPSIEGNLLKVSGSCDMKGGIATAIEAMRAVRTSL